MLKIYLDYNASTPIAPEVAAVMREVMEGAFGNPSSLHWAGTPAREIVQKARSQVASLLGCTSEEVVFTSGGSESNNLALKGVFFASKRVRRHIVTTQVEHPAIVAPLRFLESLGAEITWLRVDRTGRIDPDDLRRAITPHTILISVMHANNEVGTIQPIEDCAAIAREHGIPFHTDAAQSVSKIPTRVDELGVDLLTVAGHKLYAPKGVGTLYVRDGVTLEPLIHGAGHEGGRRAGTESAILTAALGEACVLARDLSDIGTGKDAAGSVLDRTPGALRQQRCAQRPSRNAAAEHAQRLLRRPRCRYPGRAEGRGGLHRLRLPCRSTLTRAEGYECAPRDRRGSRPLQSRARDDGGGNRRGHPALVGPAVSVRVEGLDIGGEDHQQRRRAN